jgi:ribulose-phosphate 3-epimerase
MLSADFSKLGAELKRVESAGADWAHLDVMDGMFVPNITIGPSVIKAMRPYSKMPFDVHLMIQDPIRYVKQFADAGADYLTVHTEAEGDIAGAIKKIRDLGVRPGISLNPGTPIESVKKYLNDVDLVLVMTVQPGFGGQAFRPEGVPKIEWLAQYAKDNGQHYEISVDGGINRETGKKCAEAGASVLAAGSYLFKMPDMSSEIALWHSF